MLIRDLVSFNFVNVFYAGIRSPMLCCVLHNIPTFYLILYDLLKDQNNKCVDRILLLSVIQIFIKKKKEIVMKLL